MSGEIKLGELEFKAEDFSDYCIKNPGASHSECIAVEVNRILREKLTRTTKIFGRKFRNMENEENWCFDTDHDHGDTHAARVVCIEEINPQMENKNK